MKAARGTNVFAQDLTLEKNPYVFPPFCLIYPLLQYFTECGKFVCTFIAPRFDIIPAWYPLLLSVATHQVLLAKRGDRGVLRVPSKGGFIPDTQGIRWDLFAYRLRFE